MTSISQLIKYFEQLRGTEADASLVQQVRTNYLSPALHIDLVAERFRGLNDDDRMLQLSRGLTEMFGLGPNVISEAVANLPVVVTALTPEEAKNKDAWLGTASGNSWVTWFLDGDRVRTPVPLSTQRYVHFYGYKGGQARSSILGLFAKLLADDGYKVLVIDADMEAPSMDALFGAYAHNFSQTLMGLCGWAEEVAPITAAYAGKLGTGRIDLLPCRPRNEETDLDFALLVATAPLDTRIYEKAARKLDKAISNLPDPYDFVLMDHRTGIATSVLPLIAQLPGPTAVFARTDANIASVPSEMRRVVRSIFESSSDIPGAFVSFSLDPNRKNGATLSSSEARSRETLLEELARSIESGLLGGITDLVSTEELAFNWIDWYLDREMLDSSLPDVVRLQSDNIDALHKLREVLGLPIERKGPEMARVVGGRVAMTSLSGARDEGAFIHIPDVERLFVKGNPYTYILGRKGTGKTRLLREVAERELGIPILVAADETSFNGLRSQSVEAEHWLKASGGDPAVFWWSLIRLSLEGTLSERSPIEAVSAAVAARRVPTEFSNALEVKRLLANVNYQRVFLVDGLETLVPASEIKAYVAGLFSAMNTVQNDAALSSKLVIRAFVREDLASDSVQNIEQQMEGRALRLKWSASSILNFAVSRLPLLPWISQAFEEVCLTIQSRAIEVKRSGLSEQEATELLLRVFPARIRRNNLSTATFLRLYFSDAGGDDTNMATFYPRLYLSFLQKLDALARAESNPFTPEKRLNSALLNRAYDEASTEFISETKQELVHLLALTFSNDSSGADDDQSKVTKFIAAFDGLSTPFELDQLVMQLVGRTPFTEASVRESLRRMKALRMFEDRPGYAGWWRVGQLYKMGLRMKYVR